MSIQTDPHPKFAASANGVAIAWGPVAVWLRKVVFFLMCQLVRVLACIRRKRVYLFYASPIFKRQAEAVCERLRQRGIPAAMRPGYHLWNKALWRTGDDLWILFKGKRITPGSLPRTYIMYVPDPIDRHREHNDVDSEFIRRIRSAIQMWGYSRANGVTAEALGVPFRYVPFGYCPVFESSYRRHTAGLLTGQDIDVLFFGSISPRRQVILDHLAARGLRVEIIGWENPAYGKNLDRLLARSKILLGIHYYGAEDAETQIPDFARIGHALANRIFVLHETPVGWGSDPEFVRHVATRDYADMVEGCLHFVSHSQERAEWAEGARAWFIKEYDLDRFIPFEDVQKLLESTSAAR